MKKRCPNCGEWVVSFRYGCPTCDYPKGDSEPDIWLRRHDNERDMELYDDLFDAHSKLAEHDFLD
jgi:hypothetical protein